MNILVVGFTVLNVLMLVFGLLINYGNSIVPKSVVEVFRYGRANISNNKSFFVTSIEVPKRWFAHFYLFAVIVQSAVCATIIGRYYYGVQWSSWLTHLLNFTGERTVMVNSTITMVAAHLFFMHLIRRLYETLFVSVYSNTKMNVFHYVLAYIHYFGAILCVVAHSPEAAQDKNADSEIASPLGLTEIASIIGFFVGTFIQNRAHVGLANLRKGTDKKQAMRHKIPRGGMFEWISCPNYFGEIIIYSSMACLFGFQNSSWNACTLWVICNQITSGIMNHMWYIATFKDYPKKRKAIFPLIL